jgi:uncharacterized DUF497 family protein
VRIEWDPDKNASNRKKHGISFEEAATLFAAGSEWLDLADEVRYLAIGPIARGIVVVVYVERDEDVLRIISARLATAKERRLYETWIQRYLWATTSPRSPSEASRARSPAPCDAACAEETCAAART